MTLITLCLLGIIFFLYVLFRKESYITITIKVGSDHVNWSGGTISQWFSQLFYVGMKEKDGLGRTTAEILNIRSYDTSTNLRAVYANVKLKAIYNRASNQYIFRGKPVLIGSTIRLYLDRLLVDGLVTHFEGVKDTREKHTLIAEAQIRDETTVYPETSGTKDYVADALKVGEKITDLQGNTVIEILQKRVEDAKRVVVTNDGRVLIQSNPMRKDVYFTLRVQTIKIGSRYYVFDDIPVLIGIGVPLNTSTISVWPEITKFTLEK